MEEAPHVIMFPYPVQGHIKPSFAFARALASSGVLVTVVLSASNYALLQQHSGLPTPPDSLLRVEAIADDDGAAEEELHDLCFQHSMQKMEAGLEQLIIRSLPRASCLISDLLYPWTQDLANSLAIPRVQFCVHPAIVYLLAYYVREIIAKGYLPFKPGTEEETIDFIPGLPVDQFRVSDLPADFLGRDERHLEVLTRIQRNMKEAAGVVFNSVYDLERSSLDALIAEGFSVYPMGPMLSMDWNQKLHRDSLFHEDEECLSWLDNQPDGSVIYASFGSLVTLSDEEIQELALGLEASQQPFLWVIRPDAHPHLSAILPGGFMERTKDRSMLIAWAPQIAVLSHPSIVGFLTHCGYSSTLESLWLGVPMIGCFPKVSDQTTILKLIVDHWGVGVAVERRPVMNIEGANPPLMIRCSIETAIRELLHGGKGQAVRQKIMELKATIRKSVSDEDGCSKVTFHNFLHKVKVMSTNYR